MRFLSNSANAPNTWKISLPPGDVVDGLLETPKSDSLALQFSDQFYQILQGPAETIQAPNDQRVTFPEAVQGTLQARAKLRRPADRILANELRHLL